MHCGKRFLITGLLFIATLAQGQSNLKGWYLLDHKKDSFNGISLNKTYDFLKGKKSKTVIVAVIDGGIDTSHEDLKSVLWKNSKEISGNGVDDDRNGFADDVYGWNFLGGKDGRNINKTGREASRVYYLFKSKYDNKSIDELNLTNEEKEQYALWKQAAALVEVKPEEQAELMFFEVAYKAARKNEKILKSQIKKDEFTLDEVEKFLPATSEGKQAKHGYITFMKIFDIDSEETNKSILSELQDEIETKKKVIKEKYEAPPNDREEIVKDNYYNINDRFYGNHDVMGPSPLHGTHVAGIIGAQRRNGKGIDGIADNVKLMTLRAVPDGDEYDKDIALAIIYAVDNGAKVINLSFGKEISPQKKWVDEAVRYAELKDVLLVHAAGNDGENNDTINNYPSPELTTLRTKASNFITVGASADPGITGDYIASFSNYGKATVDVFAPGVKMYSTSPGGNTYKFLQGTSMAAPVVTGVAALIRSYFPALSSKQVKYAIEKSVATVDSTVKVTKPGSKEKVPLSALCASAGWVNAYNAVKLAATLQPENREIKKEVLPKLSFINLPVKQ
jgi:subtilisin family serine protease